MKYYIYFFITIVLLLPFSVDAITCNKEQISRYEKLANQVQTTLEYRETEDGIAFDVIFHNVHNDFKIMDYNSYSYLKPSSDNKEGIIKATNYLPNQSYDFGIVNHDSVCDSKIIRKITITMPYYNSYYKNSLCNGISEFELCKKWVNIGNISYTTFVNSVNEYKKTMESADNILDVEIEDNLINNIRNFFAKYYFYIIITILVIISIIMYLINKRRKSFW